MQHRSMEHEEEEEEEAAAEEKELVKGFSFSDGHVTDLAQQIACSMLDDEDERKYEHIINELHDQSMGITASTRPMQSSRNAPPLEWRFRTCQGRRVIASHDTPLQQKKVDEKRRLQHRGDHKNTEAYMKMLYAEILRMKIESSYSREIASLSEQEEYIGKSRLHQQQIEAYKVQAMRARVALPIDVLSSPSLNNRQQNHLHRRHDQQTSCGGSGMRAVFLATHSSSQRECGGTGVFLPRGRTLSHGYNSLESKRKPACSTVLLPSRIVQALNLKVEDTISSSQPRFASGKEHPLVWHGDGAHHKIGGSEVWNTPEMIWPRSYNHSHGRGGGRTSSNAHEDNILRLPSDWTY